MAGTVLDRKLTATRASRIHFDVATERDDAEICRLLRENPMPGRIALSLEREPDYFSGADLPGEEKQTIVAREGGRVVCVGSCIVRDCFVNGQSRRVGYLGGLRLDVSVAGRFDIVRRGYQFFRELQAGVSADFYFTSIAADNSRAQSFLERGLPGMPAYEFIGEFVTLLLPVPPHQSKRDGLETGTPLVCEVCEFLNEHGCHYQFAPCWTARELSGLQLPGLGIGDLCLVKDGGRIVACAALWDQRAFKQTVIRGYAPWLARLRPALNFVARFTSQPRLPAVGATLAHAFVSHLAVAPNDTDTLLKLIAGLRVMAAARKIEFLTLGFAASNPRLTAIRARFRCREYRSRLYAVRWPDMGGAAGELDGRHIQPEVALL